MNTYATLSLRGSHFDPLVLMRRAFDLDVLRWPRCTGRMQLIATIEDPAVIQRILAHLGLPGTQEGPPPCSMTEVGGWQPPLPGVPVLGGVVGPSNRGCLPCRCPAPKWRTPAPFVEAPV